MKKHFSIIAFFILALSWGNLNAQKFLKVKLDSLERQLSLVSENSVKVEILLDLVDRAKQIDVDLMFRYSRQLLVLAQNMDSKDALLSAYSAISSAHEHRESFDSGLYYADLGIALGLEYDLNLAPLYHMKGTNLAKAGRNDAAVTYYLKSIHHYDSVGDLRAAYPRNSLAGVYLERGKNEEAVDLYQWVYEAGQQLEDLQLMAMSTHNLSQCYLDLEDWDKSREMQENSLRYSIASNDSVGIAFNYETIAHRESLQNNYEEALEYSIKSMTIFEKLNWSLHAKQRRSFVAECYLRLGQLDSAYYYAQSICEDDTNPLKYYYINAAEVLAEVYERWGDYEKALFYQKQHNQLSDSLRHTLYDEQVLALEKTLEKERLEKERNELEATQARQTLLHEQQIRRQRMIQIGAFASAGFILVILVLVYKSYKRKRRDNERLADQNRQISHQADELQSKNKLLEELSNFKEGLAHMIAHDMKNSLNSIIGFSARDLSSKEMQGINRSGNVLLNLVTNMLDVQQFEEANVPLKLQQHSVREIISEAHAQVKLLLQMKSQWLNMGNVPEELLVKADRDILIRVLVNLLINAIKYSSVGSPIALKVEVQSGDEHSFLAFSVIDQGEGISEQELPYLFDKFWQADKKSDGQAASNGLGLTFCKLAVEAHGGRIEVDSREGEGATFRVMMPYDATDTSWNEEDFKLEGTIDEELLILEEERALIVEFQEQMKSLEVYQVGKLRGLLEKMDEHQIRSPWKHDLETAVYQADEKAYRELVSAD